MKMNGKALLLKGAGASVGLAATFPALADTGQTDAWGHHGMMWDGGIHWVIGPIMMLLFLIGAVTVVALVIRSVGGSSQSSQTSSGSARQTLEERFARGEIDEEEFRKKKKALEE
jgi:putative membrane protein